MVTIFNYQTPSGAYQSMRHRGDFESCLAAFKDDGRRRLGRFIRSATWHEVE
ncbi:hypothetical protein PXK56_18305 [Phaeobacter gallaeciensis]|uniref:hypothetical protein n=1 Tax=Phaeobacter gallaeciensis TaxID=60890 RepID=UPI0023803064|nr:hypothetical protein [Phaeobacter gallaeciensis]MDE4297140.1 hypothetical protein [Phaeobacter gallaeciensis]